MTSQQPDTQPNSSAPNDGGRVVMDDVAISRALTRIAHEVLERCEDLERLYLVAIPNGGVPLARQLAANFKQIADVDVIVGVLDTTLYRDDLKLKGERPLLRETEMPSAVDDRSRDPRGRRFEDRANDSRGDGRADGLRPSPSSVQVVGLVDRGHRELPIKLDYVGKNVPTQPDEEVRMSGPDGGLDGVLEVVVMPGEPESSGGTR